MRLIDADELVKKLNIKENCKDCEYVSCIVFCGRGSEFVNACEAIFDAPTVDAVEVVRCKDCKHATMTINGECKYCDVWSPNEKSYLDGDYYCASGERRLNENKNH